MHSTKESFMNKHIVLISTDIIFAENVLSNLNRGSYTSGQMKFMTQTLGEFHQFHMKWPPVYSSVYHMTIKNGISK